MPQRIPSLCGFGLIRLVYDRGYVPGEIAEVAGGNTTATEWQYRYLSVEGSGTLMWYTDESQLFPEAFAAITSAARATGDTVPSHEEILSMDANVGRDGRVATLEIAVVSREVQIWQSVIGFHLEEAEDYGTIGTTASFTGNRADDPTNDEELSLLAEEHMDAVVSVTLKGEQYTLTLAMGGDAELLAKDFVEEQGLREDYSTIIEMELLRAQLELYRGREGQLLKQFAKVQRKVHGIIVAEAHASMAEQLAAELTEAMTKVRTKIVPDLQNKIKTLESRCENYEKATLEAQSQLTRSENSYIAENVRLKQDLLHERNKRARSASPKKAPFSAGGTPNKSVMSPIAGNLSPQNTTTGTSSTHASDIDSILGNIHLDSPTTSGGAAAGWGDEVSAEVKALRQDKVQILKQLRAVQDELNVTKYELSEAYGKKAELRKFLNFNDTLKEPQNMTANELRIKVHKMKDRIEALHGVTHALEKERDEAKKKADLLAGKLDAVESRYDTANHEKNHANQKLIDLQGEYDIKSVKRLEAENHKLKEEVVKFRGETLRLRNRLDELLSQQRTAAAATGGGQNKNEFDTSGISTSHVLTIDPASSPASRAATTATEHSGSLTPTSALLSTYPMMASSEAKSAETSLLGVFEKTETETKASGPYSSQHKDDLNPPVASILDSKANHTSVKWNPEDQNALMQRLSPVVEDRLLRVIYHRYVHEHKGPSQRDMMLANLPSENNGASTAAFAHAASAVSHHNSNTTMTLGRFIRFAKEYHLCFVGSTGKNDSVTCTPPYLVSGEVDVIFHNAAKMKVPGDLSAKEKMRPYGFRAGGGTDRQYIRSTNTAQTTGLTLTPGQFIEAVKLLACKLYSNVIELQTGTLLDCLPPRQKKAASRAVYDVLIKKKLLPISDKLGLVPWSLIYLEQAVNVFGEFNVSQRCLSSHFPQLVIWFDQYKTTYTPPSASAVALGTTLKDPEHQHVHNGTTEGKIQNKVITGLTYKGISKFANDFGIVPYLIKEPQLYGIFQEFMLWSTLKPAELHKSLPGDVLRVAHQRDHGIEEEETNEAAISFGGNVNPVPFGMSPSEPMTHAATAATTAANRAGLRSPGRPLQHKGETRKNSSVTHLLSSYHGPGKEPDLPVPLSCGLPKASTANCRLGLLSYVVFFSTLAQQAFPTYAPEHRILKLFELCAQSGGELASHGERIASSSFSASAVMSTTM